MKSKIILILLILSFLCFPQLLIPAGADKIPEHLLIYKK